MAAAATTTRGATETISLLSSSPPPVLVSSSPGEASRFVFAARPAAMGVCSAAKLWRGADVEVDRVVEEGSGRKRRRVGGIASSSGREVFGAPRDVEGGGRAGRSESVEVEQWRDIEDVGGEDGIIGVQNEDEIVEAVQVREVLTDMHGSFGHNAQSVRFEVGNEEKTMGPGTTAGQEEVEIENRAGTKATAGEKKEPAKRAKAPAKSSRTVTGIALAGFQRQNKTPPVSCEVDGLVEMRPTEKTSGQLASNAVPLDDSSKSTGKVQKGPKVKKSKPKTKQKQKVPKPPPPKHLSPQAFDRRIQRQDILFGTSSQLAHDEPASYTRQLQHVLKESEQSTHTADANQVAPITRKTLFSNATICLQGSRGLWSMSNRDEQGDFLAAEPPPVRKTALQQDSSPVSHKSDSFADIDLVRSDKKGNNDKAANRDGTPLTASPCKKFRLQSATNSGTLRCTGQMPAFASPSVMPIPSAASGVRAISTTTEIRQGESEVTEKSAPKARRTTKTKPSGGEQGTKKPRGRPRKEKSDAAEATTTTAAETKKRKAKPTASEAPKAKTPAETESRASEKGWVNIDEIEDSEPEASTPPRRRSVAAAAAQGLELELSPRSRRAAAAAVGEEPSAHDEVAAEEEEHDTTADKKAEKAAERAAAEARLLAELFPLITRAVKAEPRSRDHKTPTFYEKMLLYDPIVIEDLTRWLNEGPLRRAGREGDEDVKAAHVQKWCEAHSVCCLWRGGLRGGVKKAY